MKKNSGFTLVELVIFIALLAIMGSSVLLALNTVLRHAPHGQFQTVATQEATKCMEWFIGEKARYGFGSIPAPSTTVPSFCAVPADYTIAVDISWTTLYGEPIANYKTITVTVGGKGSSTLSTLVADY